MRFALLPLITVLIWCGFSMQAWQLSQAAPHAGVPGGMQAKAQVSSDQAILFGSMCIEVAAAAPGLISNAIAVTLPTGVALPAGATCMTTPAPGGRNVYAYIPAAPGATGILMRDSQMNSAWHRVRSAGVAANLVTGQLVAVPPTIPVGSLVDWVQTNS
ncbi:hypothetical protein [Cupriavidus basilensis]|jgi:hypothetical protein|uniref:hypothetical protein n=1 Tax=Cupriavidus basilensis TaxID=68895 RepID=UPI0023E7F1B0|nr:hypothetical protein [Cupriavidus basilensis]MDF3883108.1 hypothetical protein [Cupriavidus basilensis]